MFELSRRDFVGLCATTLLPMRVESAAPLYIYAAESWSPSGRDPFVIGLLITSTPSIHLQRIADVKVRTKYKRRVAHHTNDRFKIPCARELIYYFSGASDLRFAGRVVHSGQGSPREDEFRFAQYTKAFTDAGLPSDVVVRMRRSARGYYGRPNVLAQRQAACIRALIAAKAAARVELIGRRPADGLIELASLLSGALFRASANPRFDNPTKTAGVERLRALLDIASLDMPVKGRWEPESVR
jgi:hypothetical protein